jgi:hypothetical protein
MQTREVSTDDRGFSLAKRIEANLELAVAQGRISPGSVPHWRALSNADYEAATEALAKLQVRRPVATRLSESNADEHAESVPMQEPQLLRPLPITYSEADVAYIGFARAMGALKPGQDPRTLPSVRGW